MTKQYEVLVDNIAYQSKPNTNDVKRITESITGLNRVLTVKDLAEKVCAKGHTICLATMNGRLKKENMLSQQVFAIDIDNKGKDGNVLNKGYMTIDDALSKNFTIFNCAFIYKTFSYSDDWQRFRLVFVLDKAVTSNDEVERVYDYLFKQYPSADRIKNSNRLFFGGTEAIEVNYQNVIELDTIPKQKTRKQARQYNTTVITNEFESDVRAYAEKDAENLIEESNWITTVYAMLKDIQASILTQEQCEKYMAILSLGDAKWAYENVERLRREINAKTVPTTEWGFVDKVNAVLGKSKKKRDVKSDLEFLKRYTYQDYLHYLKIVKSRVKSGIELSKEKTSDFDENGILWIGESLDNAFPMRNYLNYEKMWGLFVELFYNEFNSDIEIYDFEINKLRRYSDNDDKELFKLIAQYYSVEVSKKHWDTIPHNLAIKRKYNPLKLRIEEVVWDGKPRVEKYFIDLLGCEDSPYTREVTKVWFTGLINRIYDPGCKFEIVPILTGAQGIGKSTACFILFPDYFTDTLKGFGHDKDDYQALEQVAIVELGELKGMKKTDIADIKNFISARFDNIRKSYGKRVSKIYRHNVFIGTSNTPDFLKDDTGERRFYPLKVNVQTPLIHPMEVTDDYILQVLAEAKTFYDNNAPLSLTKATIDISIEIQQEHKIEDPMRDNILKFLGMKVPIEWDEMTQAQRQNQYRLYYGLPSTSYHISDAPFDKLSCTEPITKTSVNEIAYIVFGSDPIKHNSTLSIHSKVRSVMDNLDGWAKQKLRIEKDANPVNGYQKIIGNLAKPP